MQVPFLDLKTQYRQIEGELKPILEEIMANGAFIGGPQVSAFEEEFAAFCGGGHCVGLNSGTDALRFALMAPASGRAMRSSPCPTRSSPPPKPSRRPAPCRSSWTSSRRPATWMSRRSSAGSPRKTRAIVPVHLYGQPADMDPILEIAAQARPGGHRGRLPGARRPLQGPAGRQHRGLAGCFSFYPGKNLGAFGDAGAVVTADANLAQTMRMLREHGQSRKYYHDIEGYTGRLDAIQAAVLRIKLRRLDGLEPRPPRERRAVHAASGRGPRGHGRDRGGIRPVGLSPLRHPGG